MTGFNVESAELQAAQTYLAELVAEARGRASTVRGEVESLLASGWRGGAAAGFRSGWEQWDAGCTELLGALESMAELLGVTGRDYTVTDGDAASGIDSAGGGL